MEWLGMPSADVFKDVKISYLGINQAWITANTSLDRVAVYTVRDDCFKCPYELAQLLEKGKPEHWKVDTGHLTTWKITKSYGQDYLNRKADGGLFCQLRPTIKEFGVYHLNIGTCELQTEVEPMNSYLPFITFCSILLAAYMLYVTITLLLRRKQRGNTQNESQKQDVELGEFIDTKRSKYEKTRSLFYIRGFLICMIIFLTTGGGGYPALTMRYGGLTIAECFFFIFSWTIGVRIPSIVEKAFAIGQSKCLIWSRILMRSVLLIFIGTMVDHSVPNDPLSNHVWCPLQRLGFAYFVVAISYMLTVQRFEMKSKNIFWKTVTSLMTLLWCWIVALFIIAIMVIIMATLVSMNCMYFSNTDQEGNWRDSSNIFSEVSDICNSKQTVYFNKLVVADYSDILNVNGYIGFCSGILGVLTTTMSTMMGLKAGVVFLQNESRSDRIVICTFWGIVFAIGGTIFALISLPLEFNLWPISSILIISAVAFLLYCLIYTLVDIWKLNTWILTSAILPTGVTSMVVLAGHMLFAKTTILNLDLYFDNHLLYLFKNLWNIIVWFVLGYVLYRKRVKFSM